MDEALRRIEKILADRRKPSRIDSLLPRQAVPKTDAAIDIAHYEIGRASCRERV